MFRHKNHAAEDAKKIKGAPVATEKIEVDAKEVEVKIKEKDTSPSALRELLEKNLKWSQIIYEQNRKINSKLFWYAFAGWIRVFIIIVPLVLAAIYLPPYVSQIWGQYQNLLGQTNILSNGVSSNTLEKFLQLLPLDVAKQEQVKTILK